MWLKELKNRGMLLAVCSKNNDATAREPFEKHPEMVLRLEDFSAFVANWEDKASNIRMIQKTLNIGMDSLVFLDDPGDHCPGTAGGPCHVPFLCAQSGAF